MQETSKEKCSNLRPRPVWIGPKSHNLLISPPGTILVSLGPAASYLPEETTVRLLRAVSNTEYDVIVKYNKAVPVKVPETVHAFKSIPQNDLLAHPKLKLFISNCGAVALIEAVYNKVPVIAFPLVRDQHTNAAFLQSRRYGKVMDIRDFTEQDLTDNINELISDASYKQRLHKAADIITDMKTHNVSDPVFWINHVITYEDNHLRSHAHDMPMYQYLMLDSIALLVFFVVSIAVVAYPVFKACYRLYKWSCLEYKNIGRIN